MPHAIPQYPTTSFSNHMRPQNPCRRRSAPLYASIPGRARYTLAVPTLARRRVCSQGFLHLASWRAS